MKRILFHVHNLSPLHIGAGQSVGVVDLPIARARATNLPLIPGSALKGVLRDELQGIDSTRRNQLFGPSDTNTAQSGAIAFGDAQLLLLPIRSFTGVIAFATCPFILHRYARDAGLTLELPKLSAEQGAITPNSALASGQTQKVLLEDLDVNVCGDKTKTEAWAQAIAAAVHPHDENWQELLQKHFIILSDDVFSFLADTATEIRARIRIDDKTRTVQDGALWYEENLPAESVLWGIIGVSKAYDRSGVTADTLAQDLAEKELPLQLGGKHTVGRGFCRLLTGEAK